MDFSPEHFTWYGVEANLIVNSISLDDCLYLRNVSSGN